MKKNLTSQDIALLAGVSQSTVSRVIRNHSSIKSKTREHVLQVIREHGYTPNAAARQMKTNRSGAIAVVVANLTNPLYPSLLHLLVNQLASHGLRTTIWETSTELDDATASAIAESDVDGVIFATAVASSRLQHQMIASRKPVVFLNRNLSEHAYDAVVSDNYKGGEIVAKYFVEGRRRHIGLLTGLSEASTILDREKGFLEQLKHATEPISLVRPLSRFSIFTYENGYQAMQALLRSDPRVDAVFCTNDIIAIGALDGARACGKRIPDDLWVVGYDDIPMSGWEAIGLTTIRQPLPSMATLVVDRLLLRIENPELKSEIVKLPNEIVIRKTTSKIDQ
jgi:LacI family transcriptional regulator